MLKAYSCLLQFTRLDWHESDRRRTIIGYLVLLRISKYVLKYKKDTLLRRTSFFEVLPEACDLFFQNPSKLEALGA